MLPFIMVIFIFWVNKQSIIFLLYSRQNLYVKNSFYSILSIIRTVGNLPILDDVRFLLEYVGFIGMAFAFSF